MLASVVLLPEPVGPVTRNNPRGRMTQLFADRRQCPIARSVSSLLGICRSTMPTLPRCLKIETRKRHQSPKAKPKSEPPTSANSCWQRSGVMLFINATVSSASSDLGFELPHPAVQPQHRRLPDGNVQIAGALLDDGVQQLVDEQSCP